MKLIYQIFWKLPTENNFRGSTPILRHKWFAKLLLAEIKFVNRKNALVFELIEFQVQKIDNKNNNC